MTIKAIVGLLFITFFISIMFGRLGLAFIPSPKGLIIGMIAGLVVSALIAGGTYWYYQNTATGQRELTDERSNLNNGLNRTITIYTADGEVIARYTGKIDLEGNDGGYVIFDYNGKRYTYYNCFVESIADIN